MYLIVSLLALARSSQRWDSVILCCCPCRWNTRVETTAGVLLRLLLMDTVASNTLQQQIWRQSVSIALKKQQGTNADPSATWFALSCQRQLLHYALHLLSYFPPHSLSTSFALLLIYSALRWAYHSVLSLVLSSSSNLSAVFEYDTAVSSQQVVFAGLFKLLPRSCRNHRWDWNNWWIGSQRTICSNGRFWFVWLWTLRAQLWIFINSNTDSLANLYSRMWQAFAWPNRQPNNKSIWRLLFGMGPM